MKQWGKVTQSFSDGAWIPSGEGAGLDALGKMGADRAPLPDAVVRHPVHGGAAVIRARLDAVPSPLQSTGT